MKSPVLSDYVEGAINSPSHHHTDKSPIACLFFFLLKLLHLPFQRLLSHHFLRISRGCTRSITPSDFSTASAVFESPAPIAFPIVVTARSLIASNLPRAVASASAAPIISKPLA